MSSSLDRARLHPGIEPLESRIAPASFQWVTDGGGTWTNSANWILVSGSSALGFPDAPGDEARIGKTSPGEVEIVIPADTTISLARLSFFNDRSFTISAEAGGRLSFEGSFPRIDVEGKGAHELLAPLTISNHFFIEHRGSAELSIEGQISESSVNTRVTKFGAGTLRLSAPLGGLRYTGTTEVYQGDVILDGEAPNTIPGNLEIGGTALFSPRVFLTGSELIRDFASVQVFSTGALLSAEPGISERVGSITVQGSVALDGTLEASRIRLEGGSLEATSVRLTGSVIEGWGILAAPVTLTLPTELKGTLPGTPLQVDYIAGPAQQITVSQGSVTIGTLESFSEVHVSGGVLELAGSLNADVLVEGGTLSGAGSIIGTLAGNAGTLSPGSPVTGKVTSSGLALSEPGTLQVDLLGMLPGQFDQLAAPSVDLAGSNLKVNLAPTASVGDVFRIVDNTGNNPSGQFGNLHEGAVFAVDNRFLQITYAGGTGNDVELTVLPAAPTATLVNDRTATFTDADGDLVTVRISKGKLTPDRLLLAPVPGHPGRANLWELDLSFHPQFAGTSVSVTARRQDLNGDGIAEGNGFANLGYLHATDNRLTSVVIRGDLTRFDAQRIGTLTAQSMGEYAELTQNYDAAFVSSAEAIGTLLIRGNLNGSSIVADRIGQLTVLGSMMGNANPGSGRIEVHEELGSASIRGNFIGVAAESAILSVGGTAGPIVVGGSLIGSIVPRDGQYPVWADASIEIALETRATSVVVRGSLIAGANSNSAQISSLSAMKSVFVGGSIVGGGIFAYRSIGSVQVRGDVLSPDAANRVGGFIESQGRIGTLTIGGSLRANAGGGLAAQSFGIISIRGDLSGLADSAVPIGIWGATGEPPLSLPTMTLGSLTVGGTVRHATIELGWPNADVQAGSVSVGGDWIASSLSVGVYTMNDLYGDADDYLGFVSKPGSARIAAITIGGQVIGTARADDSFAFTAREFGAVTIAGVALALKPRTSDPDNLQLAGTNDVFLRELR